MLNHFTECLPILQQENTENIKLDADLEPLLEMMAIRDKTDYSLERLDGLVNAEEGREGLVVSEMG